MLYYSPQTSPLSITDRDLYDVIKHVRFWMKTKHTQKTMTLTCQPFGALSTLCLVIWPLFVVYKPKFLLDQCFHISIIWSVLKFLPSRPIKSKPLSVEATMGFYAGTYNSIYLILFQKSYQHLWEWDQLSSGATPDSAFARKRLLAAKTLKKSSQLMRTCRVMTSSVWSYKRTT